MILSAKQLLVILPLFLGVIGLSTCPVREAQAMSCADLLKAKAPAPLAHKTLTEAANRVFELAAKQRFADSHELNKIISRKLSEMPIINEIPGTYGTHGAYRAVLEDGTQVLIKPYVREKHASIAKEVGFARFASLIGLPNIPPAGARIDPKTGAPASVHLFFEDAKPLSILNPRRFLFEIEDFASLAFGNSYMVRTRFLNKPIGLITFLTGYTIWEQAPRHLLVRRTSAGRQELLIDMGSGLLSNPAAPVHAEMPYFAPKKEIVERMKSLTYQDFVQELGEYFPEEIVRKIHFRVQFAAKLSEIYLRDPEGSGEQISKLYREEYERNKESFIFRKETFDWADAMTPPPLAYEETKLR